MRDALHASACSGRSPRVEDFSHAPRRSTLMKTRIALVVLFTLAAARMASADTGVLLLAHGGQAEWNARVKALAAKVNATKPTEVDRKSTRLNSSHLVISYAVFCLK